MTGLQIYLNKIIVVTIQQILPLNNSYLWQLDVEGLLTELLNNSMEEASPISWCLNVKGERQSKLKHFLHDPIGCM